MRIGLLIYGSLETVSGGYLYDRKLVEYLRERQVEELKSMSENGQYFEPFECILAV